MDQIQITSRIGLIAMLVLASTTVQGGQIYKWQDANGKWQYTQTPPPPTIAVQKIGRESSEAKKEELQSNKLFPLVLYANDCGIGCKEAEEFLKKNGLAYTKKDPTKDPKIFEEFKQKSPEAMAPTLMIGDEALVGFTASEWKGRLTDAGYVFKAAKEEEKK